MSMLISTATPITPTRMPARPPSRTPIRTCMSRWSMSTRTCRTPTTGTGTAESRVVFGCDLKYDNILYFI